MKKTYALLLLLIISISAKAQESFSFSLDEAIQYALQNNYTVRNAALDIDAATEEFDAVISAVERHDVLKRRA